MINNDNIIEGAEISKYADIADIKMIMFDYIYVKAVRNQINHASSTENLSEVHKEVMKENKYELPEFSSDAIKDQINRSIKRITEAAKKCKKIS